MAINAATSSGPQPGAQIADGRYVLEEAVREVPFGTLYRGSDRSSNHPVSVLCIAPDLAAHLPACRSALAAVRSITHKNVAALRDVVSDGGGHYYVCEFLDGSPLRELLDRKRQTGQGGFSTKSAGNIVTHVAAGLGGLHGATPHGAVSLDSVYVNKAGRVKVAFAGLAGLAPAAAAAGRFGDVAAPELGAGAAPTVQTDFHGVGAIVYEVLTGAPPVKGCQRPSEAVPELGELVDKFVGTCMHPKPQSRPRSADQVKSAIAKALTAAPTPSAQQPSARAPGGRPSLAQAITAPAAATGELPAGLSAALADNRENWLITKGKLDYGPFSLQEVVEQIRSNQILPGHTLVDNSTGDRMPVEDHPLLSDLVDEARQKRDDERRAAAEVANVQQEKRRGTALYAFIGLVVLVVGVGVYFLVTKLGSDSGDDQAEIASLEEGSLEAKITFPSDAEQKKRRARRKRKGGGGEAGGVSGGWDDSLDLDMAEEGGGSERLDDSEINPVIQRNGRQLGRCLTSTGSRSASIDFIVLGSGKVSQVRVNGETSGALANCVRKAMMSMKFPSFNGPRTKANFDMAL